MKIVGKILVLLALTWTGSATAQTISDAVCVPYKMPIDSTITSCGPGLIGSKYKTATKLCPGGTITQSTDYDTSGCVAAPLPAGTINNTSRCKLMPDSCAAAPLAQNCATGSHWTLIGSGIAHCVQDDPVCPWSTSLTHDSQGNPSCEQNTCPANQVLQGDGKSCACPTGTSWTGSTCIAQVCSPDTVAYYRACTNGADASEFVINSINCPFGPYGPATKTTSVNDADCKASADPAPAPGCTAGTTYEEANCDAGTGKKWRGLTTYCPGGASGYPSSYYSDWHTEGCGGTTTPSTPTTPTTTDPSPSPTPTPDPVPVCTVTTSTTSTSCGVGYTGTKYVTTKQLCPSGTSSAEDTSGCGCANGAADYPTCSPVPAPKPDPVTKTCKTISRVVQTDTSIGCGGSVSTTTTTAVERQTFSACTYSDGTYTETRLAGTDYGVKNCRTGIVTWY